MHHTCIENRTELENWTELTTELSLKKSKIKKSDIPYDTKPAPSSTGNAPNESNTYDCYPLHYVEGPLNVIADTFSRRSRLDDTSALVGKKAITEDSELASYS